MKFKDIESTIGNSPLVKIPTDSTHGDIFVKLNAKMQKLIPEEIIETIKKYRINTSN